MSESYSLWTVQEALKSLARLGLIHTATFGRAGVHTISEGNISVAPLRALLDPIATLTTTVRKEVGDQVQSVILFGSIARGESTRASDVDLAVITSAAWEGRSNLEDAVRTGLGNACDVLVFAPEEFTRLASAGEPVVAEILADGVALVGSMPRVKRGAA